MKEDEPVDDSDRLLDYAQGRLSAEDAASMKAALAQNPDLRAELAVITAVKDSMKDDAPDDQMKEAGWARLSASINADRYGTPANDNRRFTWVQVASVAIASVMAWHFVAAPMMLPGADAEFTAASTAFDGPVLQVAFVADANIADITALLGETQGSILGGPSAIKLFTIGFADDAALAAAETAFAAQPDLVQAVSRP